MNDHASAPRASAWTPCASRAPNASTRCVFIIWTPWPAAWTATTGPAWPAPGKSWSSNWRRWNRLCRRPAATPTRSLSSATTRPGAPVFRRSANGANTTPPGAWRTAPAAALALAELVRHLGAADDTPAAPADASPLDALLHEQHQRLRAHHQGQDDAAPKRDLKAAAEIRARHARQRTAQRIDAALAQPTGDAGPLNSHRQVVRALEQLHELAPEYLERFVGYVDTLMALEKALGNRRG